MADPSGGDPPPEDAGEDEDFEDEEAELFIGADHPAYARVQEALKRQLVRKNEQRTLELREKGEELRKLVKHREEVGVTLYTSQQQLAKLQLQLEQLHDRFAMVRGSAQETEESLKTATAEWEQKKQEVEQARTRVAKSQDELNQLNITVRQVEEYNDQMKAEIQERRRATYKAEDDIKSKEKVKIKQDILIDKMNEDVKRLNEQKALLDAQLAAQKQETEAATQTLREAGKEMEAIEFEKRQLSSQWKSSLLGMQRRDEALGDVLKAMEALAEEELAIDNELSGLKNSTRHEQERNEQLTALKDRNDKETQFLQTQMTNHKQEREKLMENFSMLKQTMDQHTQETQQFKVQLKAQEMQQATMERNCQNVSREITSVVGKIDDEVSEQTTSDRVAANSQKRIKKIREEIAAKEVDTQSLHNEIARVTVDSLNTKAHNQMLKDRQKQLSEDLGDRERLIEQYEQEIRKRHHQIEKKQLYVDRLNREYDEKRTKLEMEAGEADVAGPQEAKLKHMKKAIADLTKECADMQKDWIQKQTQLLAISTETDRLKTGLNDQKNRKMVLDQKRIRIESQLATHQKDVKELENAMKHLRFDMDKMSGAIVNNDTKSKDLANANRMMETEFVNKLKEKEKQCLEVERMVEHIKEDKAQMAQEVLEAERQALLWERKITLEKEMQEALDPNVGQSDVAAMKKEIHRMELRLEQLKRKQEQMIIEMERAINKRDPIQLKSEPKAKKTKQTQSAVSLKRQVQSLKNNLKLCTQATGDIDQKLSERESELSQLQQSIEQNQEDYARAERAAEQLRAEVQVGQVAKQRNLSALLQLQRSARRYDELSTGTGPPPPGNVRAQYQEEVSTKNRSVDVIKTLHDAYPQLEGLWAEFYSWLGVQEE